MAWSAIFLASAIKKCNKIKKTRDLMNDGVDKSGFLRAQLIIDFYQYQ